MARVTRDSRDGRWLARWRDPAGRQRKKSFDRKVDAQRWLDQLRAEMHRAGIPTYIFPESAARAVAALNRYREITEAVRKPCAPLKVDTVAARRVIAARSAGTVSSRGGGSCRRCASAMDIALPSVNGRRPWRHS